MHARICTSTHTHADTRTHTLISLIVYGLFPFVFLTHGYGKHILESLVSPIVRHSLSDRKCVNFLRLVHTYDASISISPSASTSTSIRKSTCEPGRRKQKCQRKKKENVFLSYSCVAQVHKYISCACAYASVVRVN